jgi:D-3-phosphoglycerate dehydrogenase / 2-oxoglutarate reductase
LTPRRGRSGDPGQRPQVGLACSEAIRRAYIDPVDVARLETVADFRYRAFAVDSGLGGPASRDASAEASLAEFGADLDVLVVCHGAPYVSSEVIAAASRLTLLGELEGDRFGYRLDLAAARQRDVRVVDTSHGSSWPTAEWALGLALIGLRNAGDLFRRTIAHEPTYRPASERSGPGFDGAELTGKRVGMIGFGHVARRLVELLGPFRVDALAHDPFVSHAEAEVLGVVLGTLSEILACDVVFVLVPETPSTVGMLGARELELLRPGSVLVNVSRGRVVESAALLARLGRGDVIGALDVFDPEPIPLDSPILDLPNVFLTPHIAGVTEESRRRFFSLMVDESLRHFQGLEPWSELTPEVVELRTTGRARSTGQPPRGL